MEFDSNHVDSGYAAVAGVVEEITAHSDLCVAGVLLLRAIIYTDSCVCDFAFAVVWNILVMNENDSVSTFSDSRDALSKTSQFLCVGFALQFLVLGVHQ